MIAISSIVLLFFVLILFLILEIANLPISKEKVQTPVNVAKQITYSNFTLPDGFLVDYPSDWQKIDKGLETGFLLAMIDNNGAQVGIIKGNFNEKNNLSQILEEKVNNYNQLGPVAVLKKEINNNDGSIEFTVGVSNRPLHSSVKAVLNQERNEIYFVMVSAPVDQYNDYKEIIQHIINSIKLD